jgi:hypothetical protein
MQPRPTAAGARARTKLPAPHFGDYDQPAAPELPGRGERREHTRELFTTAGVKHPLLVQCAPVNHVRGEPNACLRLADRDTGEPPACKARRRAVYAACNSCGACVGIWRRGGAAGADESDMLYATLGVLVAVRGRECVVLCARCMALSVLSDGYALSLVVGLGRLGVFKHTTHNRRPKQPLDGLKDFMG